MKKPLAVDLYCGLGGWAEGLLAEGWDVVGFDIEKHEYGDHKYPAQLVLQDVLTLHGKQFKDVDLIVASPPCQEYSYMAMPWSRAKKIAEEYRSGERDVKKLTELFDSCFRIQREACESAGRHIPMVVENVRGAQPWVGKAKANFGSYYLWGDVPALMPVTGKVIKQGRNFNAYKEFGTSPAFNGAEHEANVQRVYGQKGVGGSWFTSEEDRAEPGHWKKGGCVTRLYSSKSSARKAASAMIARIPFRLAQHIAWAWKPEVYRTKGNE